MDYKDDNNARRLARGLLKAIAMPEGEDKKIALRKIELFAREIVADEKRPPRQ